MRLTADQAEAIRQQVHKHMSQQSRIWLFASRADDGRRGGDVDLYVEPESAPSLIQSLQCKSALAEALDLNVDLVVRQPAQDLPIYRIARRDGVLL